MHGVVNSELEATLRLTVHGPDGVRYEITAVIDTGYNGCLTLPDAFAASLGLPPLAPRRVTLGDATSKVLTFHEGYVTWQDVERTIPILCVEGDPLVGTGLLDGCRLGIEFTPGGPVVVDPLS
jgi:clan AA aspartic protease